MLLDQVGFTLLLPHILRSLLFDPGRNERLSILECLLLDLVLALVLLLQVLKVCRIGLGLPTRRHHPFRNFLVDERLLDALLVSSTHELVWRRGVPLELTSQPLSAACLD